MSAKAFPGALRPAASEPPVRAALVLAALGVVFGDIGTSPLYTLQECLNAKRGVPADAGNVLGIVSLILWAVTLVVTVKYLFFLMRADNDGEGGIMALLALVPERLRSPGAGKIGAVALLVIVGAGLLFGDGIITPAISVLSAMEGLGVGASSLKPVIVPATVGILLALFAIQRRGTGGLGALFGPVMIVWFVTIGALGIAHIAGHPAIFAAVSPVWGLRFFVANGWSGFRVLGGVVLAVTGGEALYADMGHFGRKPIRNAWLGLIYPALILCYMGQGATLLGAPAAASDPFYAMIPKGPWIYPMVALAAAATVIASQALISGVFSLTHQAIQLGYFPRVSVRHTSGEAEGQIYLPLMNWGLAGACIALVLFFQESSKLAAAFGLAVSGTMLITSIVYFVVTRSYWKWPLWKSVAVLLLFLAFDIPFFLANTLKFFDGGYLPFAVGLFFVVIMVIWRVGRGLLTEYFAGLSLPVDAFIAGMEGRLVGRVPGVGVFMGSQASGIPAALQRTVEHFRVLYDINVLLTVRIEHVPFVREREPRIEDLGHGVRRVVLRYGFMESPNIHADMTRVLSRLECAYGPKDLLYVLAHETYAATSAGRMGTVAEAIFGVLSRNAKNATDYFGLPTDQVVELGAQLDL